MAAEPIVVVIAGINDVAWHCQAVRAVLNDQRMQQFNASTYTQTYAGNAYAYRRWCARFSSHVVLVTDFHQVLADMAQLILVTQDGEAEITDYLTQIHSEPPSPKAIATLTASLAQWKECRVYVGLDAMDSSACLSTLAQALGIEVDMDAGSLAQALPPRPVL